MDNPKKHGAAADSAAAAASNKRFKDAHEGPNSHGEEEKGDSVTAAPALASPIGRLYADALGEIFDFLTLSELNLALAVSRSWLAFIGNNMPCARFKLSCRGDSLVDVASSTLARHIMVIKQKGGVRCKLTKDSLYMLALAMPQLITLQCELRPSTARKLILPAKLKTLELDVTALDTDGINTAVEAIGLLTALSELTLRMLKWLPELSFAPLSACAALETLIVKEPTHVYWQTQPSDAQIDQFRALHHLRSVNLELFDSSSLTKLLRAPHSLQWTELGGLSGVGSVVAAALRNLPGLLTLEAWKARDVSFLPTLSQLQSLTLQIKEEPWAVTADALVESVSCCRQLTFLKLMAPVASKHLTALLPHLPLLKSLALCRCRELESLSFLNSVPSLREFVLDQCTHPALRSCELSHVHTLKQLSILQLWKSFADPLDEPTQELLTPPSAVLPELTTFDYAEPTPAPPAPP